jgi:ribosomal protein L11 methyltransferase
VTSQDGTVGAPASRQNQEVPAQKIGDRLWICTSDADTPPDAGCVVRLHPGVSFGTGAQVTTTLCLEWLEQKIEKGARVIDYGCGSGILGLSAVMLGASEACCFDIDPGALDETRKNALLNGLEDRVHVCSRAADLPTDCDVLISNILSPALRSLAQKLATSVKVGGSVVLAGILEHEAESVVQAYRPWSELATFRRRRGRVCLQGLRFR